MSVRFFLRIALAEIGDEVFADGEGEYGNLDIGYGGEGAGALADGGCGGDDIIDDKEVLALKVVGAMQKKSVSHIFGTLDG